MGIAALLSALLAACSGKGPAEPADPPTAAGPAPAVDFKASITVAAETIQVSYTLTNSSGTDLLVLNKVPSYDDSGRQLDDANTVYVTGKEKSQVVLSKRAFPIPDTDRKTWAQATQISGVLVPAGGSVSEQIVVKRPLKRYHPYGNDIGFGEIKLPDPGTEVVFCLGVVKASEAGGKLTLQNTSATTGVQHQFCSSPVALKP
jgi:hypothetical protein